MLHFCVPKFICFITHFHCWFPGLVVVKWKWSYINNRFIVSLSQNVPPDVSVCGFVLAHCLSVRALQEMLTHTEHLAAEVRLFSLRTTPAYMSLICSLLFSVYHWYRGILIICLRRRRTFTTKWLQMQQFTSEMVIKSEQRGARGG